MLQRNNVILMASAICLCLSWVAVKQFVKPDAYVQVKKHKGRPYEDFWMKRSFPSFEPESRAYFQALDDVREAMQLRGSIPGFDKEWTTEGPGNIGARVNSIAVDPVDENTILIGYSHGGIWKTTDGGQNWHPVFDEQSALAIGDLAFDPKNPNVVYAGTGDVNIPGGVYTGNGVYKSTDGGESWEPSGLEEAAIISKIWVDPTNSAVVFASGMGSPFVKNTERGLYKSIDGGQNWQKILFVNTTTGIIDFEVNPQNSDYIYAAAYTRIRTNYESIVSSKDCSVWRTIDGGKNWTQPGNGLPLGGSHSRIGLAMCPTDPSNVYAMYVSSDLDLEAIYKTTDAGSTWAEVPTYDTGVPEGQMGGFGWYFGKLGIDPNDCNTLHLLGVDMQSTFDGGASWIESVPPWWTYEVHADKHDIVYTASGNVLLGTDGGLYKTSDFNTWEKIENNPTSQFYRVAWNPHQPDFYYGGMQDNGTSGGNAAGINSWERLFGGDGFQPRFNPVDPNNYYFETQNAGIYGTEDGQSFYDLINEDNGVPDVERRHWDAQYILSHFDPDVLYYGGEKMYRSHDRGHTWTAISDNLTGDLKYLKGVHIITSLDESPLDSNILYAGTGNGYLWCTKDGGVSWDTVQQNGLPERYLTSVHASPTLKNTVYVTFTGYKFNELIPHVFRSDDNGQTWTDISGDLPGIGINDILIIENEKDKVLYVATDGGVYGTVNGGLNWERLGTNMPVVPVLDIDVDPVNKKLIAGTYARSIMTYPIGSITAVSENISEAEILTVFPNPIRSELFWNLTNGAGQYDAVIRDTKGMIVRKMEGQAKQGNMNIDVLVPGIYVFSLESSTRKYIKKIVKH